MIKDQTNLRVKVLLDRLINLIDSEQTKIESIDHEGLSLGSSSLILFYIYYGNYSKKTEYINKGFQLIIRTFSRFKNGTSTFEQSDYYSGLIGFFMVLSVLRKNEMLDIEDSVLTQYDELIADWTLTKIFENNIDFFMGAGGGITYLNHVASYIEDKSFYIKKLGRAFEEIAKINNGAKSKKLYLGNNIYNNIEGNSSSKINFGMAHGISSIVLNAIQFKNSNVGNNKIIQLIDQYIDTVLFLRNEYEVVSPYCFVNEFDYKSHEEKFQKRIGWCHSDLNILHNLMLYDKIKGRKFDVSEEINLAINLLQKRNSFETNAISDPFICHGYGGVAQYYLKLYEIHGNEGLKIQYDYYLKKTLEFYESHDDNHFFSSEFKKTNNNRSFFYGNVGVALVLISALDPSYKTWSELILI